MKSRVVFDFDGVLLHSHHESMFTAYNVASGKEAQQVEDMPEIFSTLFSENRSAVRSAGEMVSLAEWCLTPGLSGNERLSRAELVGLFPLTNGGLQEKEKLFFAQRGRFYEKYPELWLTLNSPYQPIWDRLSTMALEILIITHKNRLAVEILTKHYGLPVRPECIFSGDGGCSKSTNFLKLFDKFPADQYFFIDDNLRNLLELQADIDLHFPLRLGYAAWGYGSDKDAQDAHEAGVSVYTQESLISFIQQNESLI